MDLKRFCKQQWDRIAAWLCVLAGAVALILGWVGVSGEAYLANQLPYLVSGAVGGVFLLGLGAMLWLSADLRDEWVKLDRIEHALTHSEVAAVTDESGAAAPDQPAPASALAYDDASATALLPRVSYAGEPGAEL